MWSFGSRDNRKQLCKQCSRGLAYLGHALRGLHHQLLAQPCFGNPQSQKREGNLESMSRTDTAMSQIYSITKPKTWPSAGLVCGSLLLCYAPASVEMLS